MKSEKTVRDFATEKARKPKKPKTQLDYDMRRAQELGYGVHYGRYKADHPNTRAEFESLTEKKKPSPAIVTCPICGVEFVKTKKPNQKYCSPECKLQAYNDQRRESYEKRPRIGAVHTCPICKKEFAVSHKRRKYCSPECRREGDRLNGVRNREKYRQEAKSNGNV